MQVVPWLGVVPGTETSMQQLLDDDGDSPLVSVFKAASNAVLSNPNCATPQSFLTLAKQAEVAGCVHLLYLLL